MNPNLLVLRKNKQRHPLFDKNKIKENTEHRDPKTLVHMKAVNQPFESLGAGKTRGMGMQILERQPARKIIVISEDPLTPMDLENYTEAEYKENHWYIFNDCAMKPSDWTMLGNTKGPKNARGQVEESNARLVIRSLPRKNGQYANVPPGTFVYIVTTKVIHALQFVILDNYGKGSTCLLWGQKNTIRRQIENMKRYSTTQEEINANGQIAVQPCPSCGMKLPHNKNKRNAHNVVCKKNKVQGVVVRR